MSDCLSGCVLTSQHRTDCEGRGCRGCLPRPAEEGHLCAWCWQRLLATLAEIPSLVVHLREISKPYAESGPMEINATPGDPALGSVLARAWLEADELKSQVVSWGHAVLDDCPAASRGPNASPWFGDVLGWMQPHLRWCATQPWIDVMLSELSNDVSRLKATWPTPDMVEHTRHVPVPCPRCDQLSLL